jgi:cell division protein FtsQ
MLLAGGVTGTSLLLILAHDAVTQSSFFEARTITVEGNQRFSKETILKEAGVKLHDNTLAVNLNTLRYRLLALPWVAAAEVERELPDTIHIRVKERVPIAIVDLNRPARIASLPATASATPGTCPPVSGDGRRAGGAAGRLFYMDEEAEIFKPVESSDEVRVPVVTGLALSDIDFNDQSRSRLFKAVMEVLHLSRLHQNVIPLHALHRIHVDRKTGVTLYASFARCNLSTASDGALASSGKADRWTQASRNAVTINVGFGGYGSKYSRLGDMIRYLKKESGFLNFQYIDLNDSDRVVVRPFLAGHGTKRSVAGGPGPLLLRGEGSTSQRPSRRKEV